MITKEMIDFINIKFKAISDTGKLSEIGEKYIEERMNKKEDQGGFSDYWKNVSFDDAKLSLTIN